MIKLDPKIRAAIRAACLFDPVAVTAFGALTIDAAFAPGRVSVLVAVRRGEADAAYSDPALSGYLNSNIAVVLCFERLKDARRFDRLLAAERARNKTPVVTHPAPMVLQ